jgi:hypothetical protein
MPLHDRFWHQPAAWRPDPAADARIVRHGREGNSYPSRLVVESGVQPAINTGIAHRRPGVGQVGAGVARAPLACFENALAAFARSLG